MARFDPVESVIDSLLLRSGDISRRKKGLYLDCAEDVWNDLNETTLRVAKRLKIPVRKKYEVNKRTNSLELPCKFNRLSSVNVIDERGVIHPVYRNLSLHDDIVDVPAEKNCACEKKCGYNLCNLIKGYVAVQTTVSDVLPNGNPVSFNAVSRLAVGDNGIVYQQNQGIQRVYTNSVWTDTILVTTSTQMCQCETDENGCICDTEQNVNLLCASCGIRNFQDNINPANLTPFPSTTEPYCVGGTAVCPPNPNCDEWVYYCDNKMDWFSIQCGCEPGRFSREYRNVYNISENGNRLIFPHDFGFEKALVRFYEDIDLKDLVIPYIAKDTFMTGVQYFSMKQNPDLRDMAASFGQQYSREKWGLFLELNKMRIAELGKTISPAAYVPSYRDHREDRYWGWYY
jgi:hypothetical protein